jgi:hypothetical protein
MLLPQPRDAVTIESLVIAQDRNVLAERLGDEHPVERVFMWAGERPGSDAVLRAYIKDCDSLPLHFSDEILDQFRSRWKTAQAYFCSDLPGRNRTDDRGIGPIRDEAASDLREMRIAGHPPNQRVSIEQKAQERLLPTVQFFRRQGLKKLRADLYLSLPCPGLAVTSTIGDRDQFHDRLLPPSDNDFLASAGFLNEPGELGFCFMNCDSFHTSFIVS